jgi:UDP-N-acetylmuramate dehydrogenase
MTLRALIDLGGGRVEEHAAFGTRTTYRVGGTVRALVTLSTHRDLDELGPVLFGCGLPLVVLGNGSNLLVADGEHEAIGVHLAGEFGEMQWSEVRGAVVVEAGAGLDLPVGARRLANEGIVGFEWAVGVPGTFGGAVVMNAGGHGSDMAASVSQARTFCANGTREWSAVELAFGYRSSALDRSQLVTRVTLRLARGDAAEARERIKEIVRWRREHQPGGANGGSVFRNPVGDHAGRLIEVSGCKGLRMGSAAVSDKHANFIIADPGGSANDVYELLVAVRERVLEATGILLVSEHRFLGFGEQP